MFIPLPPILTAPAQPRKLSSLPRIAIALATFAAAGLFGTAHATYPGDNGAIIFDAWGSTGVRVIRKVLPGNSAVTDLGPGRYPSVSPNGDRIAFVKDNNIYVMNIDGSNVVQLTTDQISSFPAWLPDGSKLAYTRIASTIAPVELWQMKPDGSGKTMMRNLPITGGVGDVGLNWSPSGNIYTFNGGGINVASYYSPTVSKLATDGYFASWAPDGKSVLAHSGNGKVFEIAQDGSHLQNLPLIASGTSAISPDGKFIARAAPGAGGLPLLTITNRAGTSTTYSWPNDAYKIEWSRAPANCYSTAPNGNSWVLAGDVNFHSQQCAVAVVIGGDRILTHVLAIGEDQRVYHRVYQGGIPSQGVVAGWTDFVAVPGGGGNPNGIKAKKIAIAAGKDGSAQVVIVNEADNAVYYAMYSNGNWSGFTAINGVGGAPTFNARDVAIVIGDSTSSSPGNAQIIANGLDAGDLYHRMRLADGTWTPFGNITPPGAVTHALAISTARNNTYTDVLVTVTAPDGSQGRIMQATRYPTSWASWGTVALPAGTTISASSDVAVTHKATDLVPLLGGEKVQLVYTSATGNAFIQTRPADLQLQGQTTSKENWQNYGGDQQLTTGTARAVSISAETLGTKDSMLLITRSSAQ